jgi:hypothetical protein
MDEPDHEYLCDRQIANAAKLSNRQRMQWLTFSAPFSRGNFPSRSLPALLKLICIHFQSQDCARLAKISADYTHSLQ